MSNNRVCADCGRPYANATKCPNPDCGSTSSPRRGISRVLMGVLIVCLIMAGCLPEYQEPCQPHETNVFVIHYPSRPDTLDMKRCDCYNTVYEGESRISCGTGLKWGILFETTAPVKQIR